MISLKLPHFWGNAFHWPFTNYDSFLPLLKLRWLINALHSFEVVFLQIILCTMLRHHKMLNTFTSSLHSQVMQVLKYTSWIFIKHLGNLQSALNIHHHLYWIILLPGSCFIKTYNWSSLLYHVITVLTSNSRSSITLYEIVPSKVSYSNTSAFINIY